MFAINILYTFHILVQILDFVVCLTRTFIYFEMIVYKSNYDLDTCGCCLYFREYGETWHKDGSLGNKQNCFDDFAHAAEYLIGQGYTNNKRYMLKMLST